MLAVKGTVQGNTVVMENDNISNYDGKDVIITILDYSLERTKRKKLNLDKFVKPSERGEDADEYIKELRSNDRL